MKKQLILFAQILLISFSIQAQTLSFEKVWQKIKTNSKKQQASQLEIESSQIAYERAKLHWLPKLYLQAKTYQTNDPANNFIGLLEQRSLQQSDFNPDLINHPESKVYSDGLLGIDLPIYEGLSKSNLQKISHDAVEYSQYSHQQAELQQYSEISVVYASIALMDQQQKKVVFLQNEIEKILKNYQLGNKSNPVGYSALLGIKSLINKLNSFKNQIELQKQNYFTQLNELGLVEKKWNPESQTTISFIEKYLAVQNKSEESLQVLKLKKQLSISQISAELSEASNLPRLGAFAETHVFNGNKSTSNNYTAGLYLQWSLFDSSQYNLKKESLVKVQSLQKKVESLQEEESYEKKNLSDLIEMLKTNYSLINKSEALLIEQTQVTLNLFKNGSVNALQVVDVFNKRSELIQQQTEIEYNLLKAAANNIQKNNFKMIL